MTTSKRDDGREPPLASDRALARIGESLGGGSAFYLASGAAYAEFGMLVGGSNPVAGFATHCPPTHGLGGAIAEINRVRWKMRWHLAVVCDYPGKGYLW